jgi:hypothetical protein
LTAHQHQQQSTKMVDIHNHYIREQQKKKRSLWSTCSQQISWLIS